MAAPNAKVSGIYIIENANGSQYYGSSQDLRLRWRQHLVALRRGTHGNRRLQAAFNRDGEGAFVFRVIARVDVADLRAVEQRVLDRVVGDRGCYNMAVDAFSPSRGRKMGPRSREAIEKTAAAKRGTKHTPEARQRMSDAQRGKVRGPRAAHVSEKVIAAVRGKPGHRLGATTSPETRAKLSEALRGKRRTDAFRAKMREVQLGRAQSAEAKAKRSASLKAFLAAKPRAPISDETRERLRESHRGKKPPPLSLTREARAKAWETRRANARKRAEPGPE